MSSNKLFPIFLKLKNKRVLVIGGGLIALQKMQTLINTEAELTVLAPTIIDEVRALTGEFPNKRRIDFIERDYIQGDEVGYYMVIAATDIPELNNSIANRARDQMILANSVDEPDYCDFYVPSVVEAGDIKIAISTNGKAPAVAQRIRKEFEPLAQGVYLPILQKVTEFRKAVHERITGKQAARRSKLIRWYTDRCFKSFSGLMTAAHHLEANSMRSPESISSP